MGAEYEIPVAAVGSLVLRGDYTWTDEYTYDEFMLAATMEDSHDLLNGLIRFQSESGRWSFDLYGRNLLNERAYLYRLNIIGLADVVGIPGAPRTYGMRATYAF